MQKIGRHILKKKTKRLVREKQAENFKTARKAVILFDANIPGCFPEIKEFSRYLIQQHVEPTVYGYVSEKEVPDEMLLWANFEYITRKEINWMGQPKGTIVDAYFEQSPDILFVFTFEQTLPLRYLTELSPAHFKVGCYTEQPNDYDLMINPGENVCEIKFFIEQVKHYLNMLNPS